MKTLNITFEDRIFKKLVRAKERAEIDLKQKASWENFIYACVMFAEENKWNGQK